MEKGANSRNQTVRSVFGITTAALVVLIQVGCASSSKNETPVTDNISGTSRPFAVLPETPPVLPPPPPVRDLTPTTPKSVKVISEGTEETQPTLIEASRMAKARKRNDGDSRPVIEITDENLKEFSNGGQVFVLEAGESANLESAETGKAGTPLDEAGRKPETLREVAAAEEGSPEAERELFWRQSVTELRLALRHALDDLRRLELESSMLRQQYYSEVDPFVRDSEIKPRWDRSLDQLRTLRKSANEDHDALSSLLAEAKKAGVASAWLGGEDDLALLEEAARLIKGDEPPNH